MSITAKAQHIRTLEDGTQRLFLRLDGGELPAPAVLALSLWHGDIVLAEKVRTLEPTVKLAAIPKQAVSL